MTPTLNDLTELTTWWNTRVFSGKEYCVLDSNGELRLTAFPDKIVATLNTETGDAVIKALTDKFEEISSKIRELENEWDATEDKLKLSGKILRTLEYILHTFAIGDILSLTNKLNTWKHKIDELIEDNFRAKLQLAEEAESLVNNENWKETAQKLRNISESWKKIGFVDKKRNEELWNRLEHAKNDFFEKKRQNQEVVEQELLRNLDLKLELVEKAESLAESENWKETTELYKQLLEEWKKTGRTIHDKNEALWNRFITAKNRFFDRKKEHSDRIQVEQEHNFTLKLALVEKAETIKASTDWATTSQEFNQLMNEWKSIGNVPTEHANTLWDRFMQAKDFFFQAKRKHIELYKLTLDDNYAKKIALIKRAEDIKNSTNWRETTDEMNELLEEWKKIGQVHKEHNEALWQQFLAARKHFFNRKDEDRERRKQFFETQRENRIVQTRAFLKKLEEELQEELDKIEEFKLDMNTTEGPKSEELKHHLQQLIQQSEHKLSARRQKIKEVTEQLQQLEDQYQGDKDDKSSEKTEEVNEA